MFVIQWLARGDGFKPSHWELTGETFDSIDDAKAAFAKKFPQCSYRIAESYTVTRYKPVHFTKEAG